jgi:putative membrane protein
MKLQNNPMAHLSRVLATGTAVGATILAASIVRAQPAAQNVNPPATSVTESSTSHRAKEFLKDAGQANQKEIALADVAESKSQNSTVKELAHMIRADHQQNYAQVQALAQAHGVTLEASPDWMNQREIDHMQKVKEADFDQDYTKMMIKGHVKTIKMFEKADAEIQEPDIKQYAENTLPKLREHLRHSEDAARAVGVDQSTISSLLNDLPSEDRGVSIR